MAKFWKRTDLFADGGREFKHTQAGSILEGETPAAAVPTGITWRWTMSDMCEQRKTFRFGGEEFATSAPAIDAWERACAAEGH